MDWEAFRVLVEDTVSRLRAANGNWTKIGAAIRRYINEGSALGMSPVTLWDDFAISSPGIPERAGYTGTDVEDMVEIFDELSKSKFGAG